MDKVYVDSFYMNVWEEDLESNGEKALFEPGFNPNHAIYLGNSLRINTREKQKEAVEKKIFSSEHMQFQVDEFTCEEHEYGWEYKGFFVMDEGFKVKEDRENYTHMIKFYVEIKFYEERNALDYLKRM